MKNLWAVCLKLLWEDKHFSTGDARSEILLGQEYRCFAISFEEDGTSHGEPFVHPVEVDVLVEVIVNGPFDVHNSKESVAFISKSKTSKFILNFLFQKWLSKIKASFCKLE